MLENLRSAIKKIVKPDELLDGLNYTGIPSLRIFKSSNTTKLLQTAYEPSLFIILDGSKIVIFGNKTLKYDHNNYLVSSVLLPVSGKITKASTDKPFLSLQITFTMEQLFNAINDFSINLLKQSKTEFAVLSSEVTENLLYPVYALVKLLKSPQDIKALENQYLKEILYRLLITDNNLALQQLVFIENNAFKIAKTISYINENLYENLNMDELAKYSNMCIAAFHKHFKNITNVSPLQYIKIQRLQNAKKLIISSNMDISEASFYVGYKSVSQFSREYSRYFGISPSEDIKQTKQAFFAYKTCSSP
ncbi:MAG: hypothetical protein RL154_392 [Pseudomonadota bacterium]|jgi:AraC-like DNA-binding protein